MHYAIFCKTLGKKDNKNVVHSVKVLQTNGILFSVRSDLK